MEDYLVRRGQFNPPNSLGIYPFFNNIGTRFLQIAGVPEEAGALRFATHDAENPQLYQSRRSEKLVGQ